MKKIILVLLLGASCLLKSGDEDTELLDKITKDGDLTPSYGNSYRLTTSASNVRYVNSLHELANKTNPKHLTKKQKALLKQHKKTLARLGYRLLSILLRR